MMQKDPNKDIQKPSVKDRLKRKEVGEMGKPSLKAEFEADMQKERDFVLNRAKQREEAEKISSGNMIERLSRFVKDVKDVKKTKPKLLKSMTYKLKGKYD